MKGYSSTKNPESLSLGKASKVLGVSQNALRMWDDQGKLKTFRTPGGQRRVPLFEIQRIQNSLEPEVTLAYCRVSTRNQKENLERQVERVSNYCKEQGWEPRLYQDIGSGLNDKRPGFISLLNALVSKRVKRLIVEHKDRLVRIGFPIFERYCSNLGVEVLVMSKDKPRDFQEEITSDILTLITVYSARFYGRRGGKKKVEKV